MLYQHYCLGQLQNMLHPLLSMLQLKLQTLLRETGTLLWKTEMILVEVIPVMCHC
jgi:hypothetical protein